MIGVRETRQIEIFGIIKQKKMEFVLYCKAKTKERRYNILSLLYKRNSEAIHCGKKYETQFHM
jgi:hypothetical protein